ncbi:MAG: hypothetical protein VKQ33_01370 [Candidatus Sericytochromatia bacterium]|nr:hypothetical protein [Candidatus Sericytochromatia bacterium]
MLIRSPLAPVPQLTPQGRQPTRATPPSSVQVAIGDAFVVDPDALAARQAADRLRRLIGSPASNTLSFLREGASLMPTTAARRAWLEAALHDHDLRASHVDLPTARMMIARLTLGGIDRLLEAPEAGQPLGRLQALQASHDLAEAALGSIVEPGARSLASFTLVAQQHVDAPAASLALIKDGLMLLEHLPEDSPVAVSAGIATLALGHMDRRGVSPVQAEAIGLTALREITELRGTPLLQTRLLEVERERSPGRRRALIREALGAEA